MGLWNNRTIFNLGASAYDVLTRQHLWREQIRKVLNFVDAPKAPLRVLDLGCGPGISTFALAEALDDTASLQGIDIADAMIAKARAHHRRSHARRKNIAFSVEDAERLPYPADAFDLAVGHSFLYLVPDPHRVLQEVRRVLRPEGLAVFMEPRKAGNLLQAFQTCCRVPGSADTLRLHPSSTLRFLSCMVGWRLVSTLQGQLTPEHVTALFHGAGFSEITCYPTLAGLGMHCVGR